MKKMISRRQKYDFGLQQNMLQKSFAFSSWTADVIESVSAFLFFRFD
jgi:hypothetical protein